MMEDNKIVIKKMHCGHCGYEWFPRSTSGFHPLQCPRCKKYIYKKVRCWYCGYTWYSLKTTAESIQCPQCKKILNLNKDKKKEV